MRIFWAVLLVACCGDPDVPMGRIDLGRVAPRCNEGIKQSAEDATPNQCDTTLNVWAPNGRVETRPGYVGAAQYVQGSTGITTRVLYARAHDTSAGDGGWTSPSGVGVLTLDNLVGRIADGGDMDRWYLGFSSAFGAIRLAVPGANGNATCFKAEYWNGEAWTYLSVNELDPSQDPAVGITHLGPTDGAFVYMLFVAPADWAATSIDPNTPQSAYWIRFNLLDADFDAAVSVDVDNATTAEFAAVEQHGVFAPQFPTQKRYLTVLRTNGTAYHTNFSTLQQTGFVSALFSGGAAAINEPATMAVVPQFEEAFVAYDYTVARATPNETGGAPV